RARAAGGDLAEAERSAEEPAHRVVERACERVRVPCHDEVFARARGHAVVAGEADGAGRTRGLALAAEQAAAEVQRELAIADGDRLRGADVDAGLAAVAAGVAFDDG